jgi:hypothetical protein
LAATNGTIAAAMESSLSRTAGSERNQGRNVPVTGTANPAPVSAGPSRLTPALIPRSSQIGNEVARPYRTRTVTGSGLVSLTAGADELVWLTMAQICLVNLATAET